MTTHVSITILLLLFGLLAIGVIAFNQSDLLQTRATPPENQPTTTPTPNDQETVATYCQQGKDACLTHCQQYSFEYQQETCNPKCEAQYDTCINETTAEDIQEEQDIEDQLNETYEN